MNEFVSAASLAACCWPESAFAFGGRISLTSPRSCWSVTPGFAATAISSSFPSFSNSRCAVGRSKPARVAPPIERFEPNSTIPEIFSFSTGPSTCTPISSPILKSFLSAVPESITTSSVFGQLPSTSRSGLKGESPSAIEKPRFGAPPKTIALLSLPISDVESLSTLPSACADVRQLAHLGEQRLVERRVGDAAAVREVERGLPGDDDVRPLADVSEDLVERAVDRVGQHERPADHRDAEDDRERGQDRAQLARQEPFERKLRHGLLGVHPARGAPRRLIS